MLLHIVKKLIAIDVAYALRKVVPTAVLFQLGPIFSVSLFNVLIMRCEFTTFWYSSLQDVSDEYLDDMMNQAPGAINFTMFLTLFGERLQGTDPEDVIRNAFACFDEANVGTYYYCLQGRRNKGQKEARSDSAWAYHLFRYSTIFCYFT